MASAFVHRQPYLFWAARAPAGTRQNASRPAGSQPGAAHDLVQRWSACQPDARESAYFRHSALGELVFRGVWGGLLSWSAVAEIRLVLSKSCSVRGFARSKLNSPARQRPGSPSAPDHPAPRIRQRPGSHSASAPRITPRVSARIPGSHHSVRYRRFLATRRGWNSSPTERWPSSVE
jgi:hypothetical protein